MSKQLVIAGTFISVIYDGLKGATPAYHSKNEFIQWYTDCIERGNGIIWRNWLTGTSLDCVLLQPLSFGRYITETTDIAFKASTFFVSKNTARPNEYQTPCKPHAGNYWVEVELEPHG